jgi:cell division protein FtsB
MNREPKYRPNWFRLLLIMVVSYFIYTCAGGQAELNAIRREAVSTNSELVQLQQQNEELKRERAMLQTPAYVEKLAREELGLVKPGETPYVSAGKN